MELAVVSYPEVFPDEQHLITQLFESGMERFHLRKPTWSSEQVEKMLNGIPVVYYKRIVLHDHFELARKYDLGGIHFTHRTKSQIGQDLDYSGTKSVSCHSVDELPKYEQQIDYAFLSPVFPSISKPGYQGTLELEKLIQYPKDKRNMKIFALGGVAYENIEQCIAYGFDGVALLGTIWQKESFVSEMINRFKTLLKICQKNALT